MTRGNGPLKNALARSAGLLVLIAQLLLSAACATDPVTRRSTFNYYSLDQEIQMGRQTLAANEQEMKTAGVPVNRDRDRLSQIETIVRRISAVSDLPHLPYSVTLFQTNIVNAAAAPGGSMMVVQGLYDPRVGLVQDENEMAAVLGHEIAHVNCRHVTERMCKVVPLAVITELGAEILARKNKETAAMIARGVFVAGTALWIPAYSRQDELEADRVGTMYMAKAGYDPRAALRIWKRAAERPGAKDKASIFATHPSDKARYKALAEVLPAAMEEYRKVTGHYPPDYDPNRPAQP